jgi:pimeloyl-ACP methyl ester carboxylesterase
VLKSFAGGRLFGGAWGDGRPSVLVLHGWARTHADFDGVFADRTAPVPGAIGPDLPGFGATPAPPEPEGSEWYAEQLLPLFEDGQLADRVVVVGHSNGGRVAVRLQQMLPDRIDRLVLTGVPLLDRKGRRARPPRRFRIGRRLHRVGLIGEERMEALRMRYGSPDYRAASGVMRGVLVRVLAERFDDVLPAVTCPVALLWGADDEEVPVEVAQRAAAILPRATLEVIGGVGHLTPLEAPDAVFRALVGADGPAATSPIESGRPSGSQ